MELPLRRPLDSLFTADTMAEQSSLVSAALKAPKDKNCPFCQQAFTSSSLGRHLDLYIKPKNPKAPDGIHIVEEIRKIRGGVTRRQSKGPLRRNTSASVGTPTAAHRRSSVSEDAESSMRSPPSQRDGPQLGRTRAWNALWDAPDAMNDVSMGRGELGRRQEGGGEVEDSRSGSRRTVTRQGLKQQFESKHRLQDALDRAKAAELALRELISSWRAAKHQSDLRSTPFDFDPLSLDFPALTLQCLEPPPTLFSSTQHPTPTSWSITPPGQRQQEALCAYFAKEFRKWKATCTATTKAIIDDGTCASPAPSLKPNVDDAVHQAMEVVGSLEEKVYEHIQNSFKVWAALTQEQRTRLWIVELARGVGRKQKDIDKLTQAQQSMRQENANLRSQIEQLNRSQQPYEFKIAPPTTIFLEPRMLANLREEGVVPGTGGTGLNLGGHGADLGTVVTSAIDRWKNVVLSARSATSGLQAQQPLNSTYTDGSSAPIDMTRTGDQASGCGHGPDQSQRTPLYQGQQLLSPALKSPLPLSSTSRNALLPGALVASAASEKSSETQPQDIPASNPQSVATSSSNEDDDIHDEIQGDEDMSDEDAEAEVDADVDADADADMEADTGHEMIESHLAGDTQLATQHAEHIPPQVDAAGSQWAKMPAQHNTARLDIPRARNTAQSLFAEDMVNSAPTRSVTHVGHSHTAINMAQSMSNTTIPQSFGSHLQSPQHSSHGELQHTDLGMMQNVTGNEAMYID